MNLPIEVPDWTRAIQLVGSDPSGNPVLVALDADGNIIAIMKATYSGTLKNVACDSEGRMIMIPTDPADVWGNAISMGNAELAACLTPAKRFDRRGNIFFVDTFEEGLTKWLSTLSGTSAAVELSASYSFHGGFSVKLTAGSDSSCYAYITHRQYHPTNTKIGFEFAFTLENTANYIQWEIAFFTGSRVVNARVRFDQPNSKLQYYTTGSTWADLATGVNLSVSTVLFHVGKLVIDAAAEEYLRFLLDENEHVMSDLACQAANSSVFPRIDVVAYLEAISGNNPVSYIDNTILTFNE